MTNVVTQDLSEKCHPIGIFNSIENLMVANDMQYVTVARISLFMTTSVSEIHRLVLIDTPISGYFSECLGQHTLDETRVEFVRNSVYKVIRWRCAYCFSLTS